MQEVGAGCETLRLDHALESLRFPEGVAPGSDGGDEEEQDKAQGSGELANSSAVAVAAVTVLQGAVLDEADDLVGEVAATLVQLLLGASNALPRRSCSGS